jgi:hypothetical protein
MRSNNLKEFLAYIASDYPEAIVTSSWVAREFKKKRIAARDFPVLPEILTILANEPDLDSLSYEDARARVASKNWAYLNGQVLFGAEPHLLLRELAKQQGAPAANYIASAWMSGTGTPHGSELSVAHGEILPTGHVSIYNSNTDRNTVRDAVENTHRRTAGRGPGNWDDEPDETDRKDVEWVPTHVLSQMLDMDRTPGTGHPWEEDPEYWQSLKDHVSTNGVKSPVVIDYNPEHGLAFVSEGNHRVSIANELGHTHLPARVMRSRQKSYQGTNWPVSRSIGDIGQYLKPSQIGLPVRDHVSSWQVVGKANYDGQMVSLDLPPGIAQAMMVPGGEPIDQMHLTIAYLDQGMKNPGEVKRIVDEVSKEFGPINAQVEKLTEFPESNDGDIPVVALVKGDQLEDLHQAVKAGLKGIGESVSERYDFKPHVTLEYIQPGATFKGKDPTGISMVFPSLNLHDGGAVEEFPLGKGQVPAETFGEKQPSFAFSNTDWQIVNGT